MSRNRVARLWEERHAPRYFLARCEAARERRRALPCRPPDEGNAMMKPVISLNISAFNRPWSTRAGKELRAAVLRVNRPVDLNRSPPVRDLTRSPSGRVCLNIEWTEPNRQTITTSMGEFDSVLSSRTVPAFVRLSCFGRLSGAAKYCLFS